jgi:hypothetical protein
VSRREIIGGGSVVLDVDKLIDRLPPSEELAAIRPLTSDAGGPGLDLATDLIRLGRGAAIGCLAHGEHHGFRST